MVVTGSSMIGSIMDKQEIHFVTGGGGYAGFNLGKALAAKGHHVRLFDVREPLWDLTDGMEFIQGSICDLQDVYDALRGSDVVYHLASYGMSGREQLNKKLIEQVNIGGTLNVLDACLKYDVTRFVYTSTYNVVFYGEEIKNGDESLPYVPEGKFTDHYSMTKMRADRKVICHNGLLTCNGSKFRTCVLRLAGVYGPGEQRHLPRVLDYLEGGLFKCTVGPKDILVDFLHIDNLIQAHIKAATALTAEKDYISAGKSYFISDDKPINNFEFFRPLVEGLGYTFPKRSVPLVFPFYFAKASEIVHSIIRPIYNFQPILTTTEVYKTSVTHYFSMQRAKDDLEYQPTVQNDWSEIIAHCRKTGRVNKKSQSSPFMYYLVSAVIVVIFFCLLMQCLPFVVT